ncbi:MAG TPA: SRPBCC domain-containing protein [Candidatus Polarisedimenticolaceae bacterium]|nr:SRPBCC domain-containing protein [Candidatus Polarisedimenticolaceae bacterium]
MPVKKDASGRRWIAVEAEVPGTPEQVWKAIATGPGISAWFVPSTLEERVGGVATASFGPGMDSAATIATWEPPRRYALDGKEGGMGPGSPAVADEWTVEAKAGGTCVVRVVHSLFAEGDDWDNQLEGFESGWPAFFRILRLYLQHFPGQPSSAFAAMGMAPKPRSEAWKALTGALGLAEARQGDRVRSAPGAPPFAGVVEHVGTDHHPELLLRLEEPAPGAAHLFPMDMGEKVFLSLRLYLYGATAAAAAAREEPRWQAWLGEHFPAGDAVFKC